MSESKLKIDIRRNKILEILSQQGTVQVSELAEVLNATNVTIRNDLDALANEGKLVRINGGALLNQDVGKNQKTIINLEQKKEIAKKIDEQIKNGDTLFINSGTTSLVVAKRLKSTKRNLNVVTNSFDVAEELGGISGFRVILLGGEVNSHYSFTYGAVAQEQLNLFSADWAILSVDGVSETGDIATCHTEEAVLDRIMIARSSKTLIAADSSKIGRNGFSFVCTQNDKISVITND